MSIINLDELWNKRPNEDPNLKNHPLFPQHDFNQPFCLLVSGSKGSGKTNLVVSAIICGQIKFDKLFLVTATPEQPKYVGLKKWCNDLEKEIESTTGERL